MAAVSILVVDDDPNIRSLLRLYLERDRHRVTEAADGLAALAAAADRRFDLVLLDVMLPGMDGMEVWSTPGAIVAPSACSRKARSTASMHCMTPSVRSMSPRVSTRVALMAGNP
jgi:DNA-binding NarL/FixJ family response regulator